LRVDDEDSYRGYRDGADFAVRTGIHLRRSFALFSTETLFLARYADSNEDLDILLVQDLIFGKILGLKDWEGGKFGEGDVDHLTIYSCARFLSWSLLDEIDRYDMCVWESQYFWKVKA